MKKIVLLLLFISSLSHAAAPALLVNPYLLNPTTNSMTVMFEINSTSTNSPHVNYKKTDSTEEWKSVPAVLIPNSSSIFMTVVNNLEADTLYDYEVITDDANNTKTITYNFKTWPSVETRHTAKFIAVADNQFQPLFKEIIEKGVMVYDCNINNPVTCAQNIRGLMLGGDLTTQGSTDQFRAIFKHMQAMSPYVPLIPVAGNHEYYGTGISTKEDNKQNWAKTYRSYFYGLPKNNSTDFEGLYYETSYLTLKILGIDTTPMSGKHGGANWSSAENQYGLAYFNLDFTNEQQNWFINKVNGYKTDSTKYVLSLSHHPCLSRIWRDGESMAACELISHLEQLSRDKDVITGNFYGHVHAYQRGHSRDIKHLWLNSSTAGGAKESLTDFYDRSNLDHYLIGRSEYGYSTVAFDFGGEPALTTQRRSTFSEDDKDYVPYAIRDEITIKNTDFNVKPKLDKPNLGTFYLDDLSKLILSYNVDNLSEVLEAEWQISRDPKFVEETYIVWGNQTRAKNLFYDDDTDKPIDMQKGRDMRQFELGQNVVTPPVLWPARPQANNIKKPITTSVEMWDRWGCERTYSYAVSGDTPQGRVQCTHELKNGVDVLTQAPSELTFAKNQTWYFRVKVRDQFLNWGAWSDNGHFRIGPMDFVEPDPEDKPTSIVEEADKSIILPNENGELKMDVITAAGCKVESLQTVKLVALPDNRAPAKDGMLAFDVNCQEIEAIGVTANIVLEIEGLPANAEIWWHSLSDNQWYKVDAEINGNTVSYNITDGGFGDDSKVANGIIKDPIAVLIPVGAVAIKAIPNKYSLAILLLLLLIVTIYHYRFKTKAPK